MPVRSRQVEASTNVRIKSVEQINQTNSFSNGTEVLRQDTKIEYQQKNIKKAVNTSLKPENSDHARLIAKVEEKPWLKINLPYEQISATATASPHLQRAKILENIRSNRDMVRQRG